MKRALATSVLLISFTCSADAFADAGRGNGCSALRSALGGFVGAVAGTLIFPGVGTVAGAAVGAGAMCGYDSAKPLWQPPAAPSLAAGAEQLTAP